MAKGYSSGFVNDVNASDKTKIGVKLALACIKRDIPVTDVAEFFKVSRVTVYAWFCGKTNVPEKHRDKMQKLVEKLSQFYWGARLATEKSVRRHTPAHPFFRRLKGGYV